MSLALLLPAGLAALGALLLPLLLHLARRSEQRPTVFAALRWLRQAPKPRHRLRFDEWPLLLLRLLLLALLALWLARPVLSGGEDGEPYVAVAPGVAPELARRHAAEGARLHWLAPGFPALDHPVAIGGAGIGSLLRQLDSELPSGTALTVVVPQVLQGADAQRPRLARDVHWVVVDGAMPATTAPAPGFAPVLRHDGEQADGLRYLRAAMRAWTPAGATPDIAPLAEPLPASARQLLWLAPTALPAQVQAWVREGGVALLDARTPWPAQAAAMPVWYGDEGGPLVESMAFGRGRLLRFTRPLQPAEVPALAEADFPRRLRALLAESAEPARVAAVDYAPHTGAAPWTQRPRDLQPWLALLIALLVLAERWLATRRARGPAP